MIRTSVLRKMDAVRRLSLNYSTKPAFRNIPPLLKHLPRLRFFPFLFIVLRNISPRPSPNPLWICHYYAFKAKKSHDEKFYVLISLYSLPSHSTLIIFKLNIGKPVNNYLVYKELFFKKGKIIFTVLVKRRSV